MTGRWAWPAPVWALLLAGCTPSPPAWDTAAPAVAEVEPAVVSRADITSVLTVDAVIVATPTFAVLAEADCVVNHVWLKPDSRVTRGQRVAWQGDTNLRAPVDGFLVGQLVPDGVFVHAGVPVAQLRYAGFGASATIPASLAYRLYDGPDSARLQVTGGPGPSDCSLLPVAATSETDAPAPVEDASGSSEPQLRILCAIPGDITVIDGTGGVLGITTGQRSNVLTLPLAAVAGSADVGTVVRLVDGEPVLTEVTLGITDGVRIEIIDGLEEGDEVWPYGPDLRPRLPGRP